MNHTNCKEIKYQIVYKKIKNLYIQIKNGEVIVKAPKYINKKYIEKFIEQKREWILEKLEESKNIEKDREYTKDDVEKLTQKLNIIFSELVQKTKLVPNKIRIRNIKYAWGSCSSNKNITINLKLVDKSDEEIRYVVLHELCHLRFMNHSKEFWSLVEKYMSNYKEIRKNLKNNR